MENLSDVQLKRCVAWMRLELLAWICLCADALVSVWAPSVWDTGRIYDLFVVVVLVSGLAAVVLSWVPELSIGILFVWNSIYMLVAYERELRRRKKKEES